MNRALDFDYDLTHTYVQVQLQVQNGLQPDIQWFNGPFDHNPYTEIFDGTNMYLEHEYRYDDSTRLEFVSAWIPLEKLNQVVFSLNYSDVFEFSGTMVDANPETCELWDPFDINYLDYDVKRLSVKLLHDMYFEQIGSWDEQINTTQVHTYLLYDDKQEINLLGTDFADWEVQPESGTYDKYLPGIIELEDESIELGHPFVSDYVLGSYLVVSAQEIHLSGTIDVQSGYSLILQALEEIKLSPGTVLSPDVHLRVKDDFYSTPIFDYTDNSEVYNLCNNSTGYQANIPSFALKERINNEMSDISHSKQNSQKSSKENKINLYPNPAKGSIQISASTFGITDVEIFDLAGRKLIHENYGDANSIQVQVNIQSLSMGVYIVKTHSGNEIISEKLVVGK